jgi:hypothetical protein
MSNHDIDSVADAVVTTLQPFAESGVDAVDAISALVGVIIKIADEYGEKHRSAKGAALTEAVRLLKESTAILEAEGYQTLQ